MKDVDRSVHRMGRPGVAYGFFSLPSVGGAFWKKAFSRGKSSSGASIDKGFLTSSACMHVARTLSSAREYIQGF